MDLQTYQAMKATLKKPKPVKLTTVLQDLPKHRDPSKHPVKKRTKKRKKTKGKKPL